jgi:alkylhydroperoxidase/carboxymuconolactone decarboxylase family protein YurZ
MTDAPLDTRNRLMVQLAALIACQSVNEYRVMMGAALHVGATPTTSMTHIAIQEALEGKNVNWLQKVTDEEYLSGPQRQNGK